MSGPDAVQTKLPVFGAAAASSSKVAPPSRLSSIDTGSPAGRLCVQVIVTGVPAYASVPADGPVTVSAGVAIANAPLVLLSATGSGHRHPGEDDRRVGPETTQAKLPVLGAAAASVSNVRPPSRLNSTMTGELPGRFVDQVIASGVPA